MKKEPFVINLSDKDLPNMATGNGDTGFEYSQTNIWQEDNLDILKLLNIINEKMDIIIRLLKEKGKA